MASRVCWFCGAFTHMTIVEGSGRAFEVRWVMGQTIFRKYAAFTCDQCHNMSIGMTEDSATLYGRELEPWLEDDNVATWLPEKAVGRRFADVPAHIAEAATEADACASLGLHRAAGAMARAVVEATAKVKGFTTGRLVAKIDAMHAAGLIREHVKDIAHEIRYFGNDMAHGDFVDPVSEEEAAEVIELMTEVLNEVFQSPARLEQRKAARLQKKAESGS